MRARFSLTGMSIQIQPSFVRLLVQYSSSYSLLHLDTFSPAQYTHETELLVGRACHPQSLDRNNIGLILSYNNGL